jgi:uncharacterized membrane protein YeaQ/YmgE (transglycosylase-associated protein family)
METFVWIIAGAAVGWTSYAVLRFNAARGVAASMAIGAMGAVIGAKAIAPMFLAEATPAGELSVPLALFAGAAAFTFSALAQLLLQRWDL